MPSFEYTQFLWAPCEQDDYWHFVRNGWTVKCLGWDWLKPGYLLYEATRMHN